jgi:hypothetical protein
LRNKFIPLSYHVIQITRRSLFYCPRGEAGKEEEQNERRRKWRKDIRSHIQVQETTMNERINKM